MNRLFKEEGFKAPSLVARGICSADVETVGRIGAMLKNVYDDGVVQLQNQATVIRKKFTKAKAVRVSGDHYEMDVRVSGNRGGVGARLSDDPMPVAKRQVHQKAMVRRQPVQPVYSDLAAAPGFNGRPGRAPFKSPHDRRWKITVQLLLELRDPDSVM